MGMGSYILTFSALHRGMDEALLLLLLRIERGGLGMRNVMGMGIEWEGSVKRSCPLVCKTLH